VLSVSRASTRRTIAPCRAARFERTQYFFVPRDRIVYAACDEDAFSHVIGEQRNEHVDEYFEQRVAGRFRYEIVKAAVQCDALFRRKRFVRKLFDVAPQRFQYVVGDVCGCKARGSS